MTQHIPTVTSARDPLRRLARYAGSNLVMRVLSLAYAYAKPRYLSPALLGLWNILNLVPLYAAYLHLGSRNAMEFRAPKLLSEGRVDEAAQVMGCVYYATLVAASVISAVVLLLALFGGFDAQTTFGLACLAPTMMVMWYLDQQLAVLKAQQRFEIVANANLLRAASVLAINLPLVVLWGFEGVCVGFGLSMAVVAIFLRWRNPLTLVRPFDRKIFVGLVREGAPVMVFVATLTLLGTTDRMIIGWQLGLEQVGFYALALVAAGFALQVPLAARDMLEPRLMASLISGEPAGRWREFLILPLLNVACYFPILVAALAFLADEVLDLILPHYLESAMPAVVLCASVYFLAQIEISRGILVVNRWQARVLPFLFLGVAANVGLSMLFIQLGWGISGVALASGISAALSLALILLYALIRGPLAPREWLPALAAIFGAPAASVGMIWAISSLVLPGGVAFIPSLEGFGLFILGQLGLIALIRLVFPGIRPLPLPRRLRRRVQGGGD